MAISSVAAANVASSLSASLKTTTQDNQDSFIPFEDLLKNAISQVTVTNQAVQQDVVSVAKGETDSLHTITIDSAKADLALQTLVQVRNKALDAYNEIMRITL
jgi:flagellar hook-basal body complex protein FliE